MIIVDTISYDATKKKLVGYLFAGFVLGALLVALIYQVLATTFTSPSPISKYPDNWGIYEVYRGAVGYSSPSRESTIVITLPKNAHLRGMGNQTTHFEKVVHQGKVMWVLKSAVH